MSMTQCTCQPIFLLTIQPYLANVYQVCCIKTLQIEIPCYLTSSWMNHGWAIYIHLQNIVVQYLNYIPA